MNEQNWQLSQSRPDLYIPGKLPFFKSDSDTTAADDQLKPPVDKDQEEDLPKSVKLKREHSKFTENFGNDQDGDQLIDTEVRDLLFSRKDLVVDHGQQTKIGFSEHEPLLV